MFSRLIAFAGGMSAAERQAVRSAARGPRVGFWRFVLWYFASGGLEGLAAAQIRREREAAARVEIIPPARSALPPTAAVRRPMTIRGRFVLLCAGLAALCIVMGYVTATVPPKQVVEFVARASYDCARLDPGETSQHYRQRCTVQVSRSAPGDGPAEPNYLWFIFALWPALVAVLTAMSGYVFFGRPW
jgi:hypothetical protein